MGWCAFARWDGLLEALSVWFCRWRGKICDAIGLSESNRSLVPSSRTCCPPAEAVTPSVVDWLRFKIAHSAGDFAAWEFATYQSDFGDWACSGMRWAHAGLFAVYGGVESRCENEVSKWKFLVLPALGKVYGHPSAPSVATSIGPLALRKKWKSPPPCPRIFALALPSSSAASKRQRNR